MYSGRKPSNMSHPTNKIYGSRIYISTYATSLFIQLCTVLQGALLARLLGPQGRGEFAAILLWPSIFATVGLCGINMSLTRRAGKTKAISPLVKSAVLLSCLTGAVTVGCCYISLPFLIPGEIAEILPLATVFLFFIPLNHMALNLLGIDQGTGNFKLLNFTRAQIYPVFFMGLTATWYFAENRLLWVVISLLIGNVAVVAVRLGLKWSELRQPAGHAPLFELIREGAPYQLTTMFNLLGQYLDQVLLLWLLGPLELGIYVVARSTGSIIASLPASLGIISLSAAARLNRENGFEPLAQMIRRGATISIILAGFLAPFLPFLIPFIYGSGFKDATPLALILLFGVILAGLANVAEQALRGHGKPMAGISARIAGIITLGIAGSGGAYWGGGIGVALGYVVSQLIILIMFLRICVKFFKNAYLKDFIPQSDDVIFLFSKAKGLVREVTNFRKL